MRLPQKERSRMKSNNIIVNGVSPSFPLDTPAWKELSVMESLAIPPQKPDMKRLTSLNIEARITHFEVVRTPVTNANFEGIISTGYKLIVTGVLVQFIEYIADTCEQSAHSAHFEVPFCTYIVLPDYYEPGNSVTVNAIVEDVFVEQTSPRCFFKNVTLFVFAALCCGIAEGELPVPLVTSQSKEVDIVQSAPSVYTVTVCADSLPQLVQVLSTPPAQVDVTTQLPPGYFYSGGVLSIQAGAEDATLGFSISAPPCDVPFVVNVIVNHPPTVTALSQTPENLKVEQKSPEEFSVYYSSKSKSTGVATFVVEPYEALALATALPAGYAYANNVLTISPGAASATLIFVTKENACPLSIVVNVSAE